jgi:hypothetical protein
VTHIHCSYSIENEVFGSVPAVNHSLADVRNLNYVVIL